MTDHVVDARGLPPPEPLERTLDALDLLSGPGDAVVLLLHREPYPLYDILARNGFRHATRSRDDGTVEIRITAIGA
jgi:Uncharacterized conserved protein (DUF2249)